MSVSFLSPHAALVAVVLVVPLAAFIVAERRARRVRAAIRLPEPSRLSRLPLAVALAAVPALLALAAAQPVLTSAQPRHLRTGTEAFFVLDTSRSMLAAREAADATRFERATSAAMQLRRAIPDVPVGLASLMNRLLPHLFPTTGMAAFASTLERSLGVEKPPPDAVASSLVTTFEPLTALRTHNYFSRDAKRRLVVVFTDGETNTPVTRLFVRLLSPPAMQVIFVHVWKRNERVFTRQGYPEPAYRADPESGRRLARLAALVQGDAFAEGEPDAAAAAVRELVRGGTRIERGSERRTLALAPYAVLGAFLPLALVLSRRNL